jgi:hypothetical protein
MLDHYIRKTDLSSSDGGGNGSGGGDGDVDDTGTQHGKLVYRFSDKLAYKQNNYLD